MAGRYAAGAPPELETASKLSKTVASKDSVIFALIFVPWPTSQCACCGSRMWVGHAEPRNALSTSERPASHGAQAVLVLTKSGYPGLSLFLNNMTSVNWQLSERS